MFKISLLLLLALAACGDNIKVIAVDAGMPDADPCVQRCAQESLNVPAFDHCLQQCDNALRDAGMP